MARSDWRRARHVPKSTLTRAQDRLATLEAVRAAGISVCAGGIIGLGEGAADRVGLLLQLATLRAHPESVPINALARRPGPTRPPTLITTLRAPGAAGSAHGARAQRAQGTSGAWAGSMQGCCRVHCLERACGAHGARARGRSASFGPQAG